MYQALDVLPGPVSFAPVTIFRSTYTPMDLHIIQVINLCFTHCLLSVSTEQIGKDRSYALEFHSLVLLEGRVAALLSFLGCLLLGFDLGGELAIGA